MQGELYIELVIREIQEERLKTIISNNLFDYKVYGSQDKLIYMVPKDWTGFTDGTLDKLLSFHKDMVYVALAYVTDDAREKVLDLSGEPIEKFDININGTIKSKYVKKKLMILTVQDEAEDKYSLLAYVLNLKYPLPVQKVLDIFSIGKLSGFGLKDFLLFKKN